MTGFRIIAKDAAKHRTRPHVEDYEAWRRSFDWERAKDLLHWFERDRSVNICHEAVDRHAHGWRHNKVALFWESKEGGRRVYTFGDLARETSRFANFLRAQGVKKGDRVFFFLNRVPELYIGILGTLKAGCVAGPLFSAFGPDAVRDRLQDSGAVMVVTDEVLKQRVDQVRHELPALKHIVLAGHTVSPYPPDDRVLFWNEGVRHASPRFACERTSVDDVSIMHYTSGTTGKPKGAYHRHNSIVAQAATAKYVLDLHEEDVYWCTADPGWVTGTSYGIFGAWANGATSVVLEAGFDAARWYRTIESYGVTMWYTAPTAIRMLMKAGASEAKKHDLSSLRYICSVGEPLNPEAVVWGLEAFGLAIHDGWWQTETGAIMIANYPSMPVKPGSMGKPFAGIDAGIVDDHGREVAEPRKEGNLCLRPGWPSMFVGYWNRKDVYEAKFKHGWYWTGDRAFKDEDGYFWFVGRSDDVIKTAGHLVGPFEVESALVEHPAVAEAGVIGKPDPERNEIIKAFVALRDGHKPSEGLAQEIREFVRHRLAAHAYPREIQFVQSLPKTRSGKIMRRLLKARELGLPEGDKSTLEED
jgi:acetyl-CoA synthetase